MDKSLTVINKIPPYSIVQKFKKLIVRKNGYKTKLNTLGQVILKLLRQYKGVKVVFLQEYIV